MPSMLTSMKAYLTSTIGGVLEMASTKIHGAASETSTKVEEQGESIVVTTGTGRKFSVEPARLDGDHSDATQVETEGGEFSISSSTDQLYSSKRSSIIDADSQLEMEQVEGILPNIIDNQPQPSGIISIHEQAYDSGRTSDMSGSEGPSRKTSFISDIIPPNLPPVSTLDSHSQATEQPQPVFTDSPQQQETPEQTVMAGESHPRLSQQNSLEKASESGPQTIKDLQEKLQQLTSQPPDRIVSGTPPSHPATPHVQHSYDSYMQTLQQKLASISMPSGQTLGPLSPQSTLHAGVTNSAVMELVSQSGLEGVAMLPVDITTQTVTMLAPSQPTHLVTMAPLLDSSGNSSSGVMSPSQSASREELLRQQRPRPAAIDLHDLEQELAKIHTGHRPVLIGQAAGIQPIVAATAPQVLSQPVAPLLTTLHPVLPVTTVPVHPTSTPTFPVSVNTTPDDNANTTSNSAAGEGTASTEVRRVSRFQVSTVSEDSAEPTSTPVGNNVSASGVTAVRRGRFSVVTHPDEPFTAAVSTSDATLTSTVVTAIMEDKGEYKPEKLPNKMLHGVGMEDLFHSKTQESESEEELAAVLESSNEDFKLLLQRQQMELEALRRRHQEEIEAFRRHQQMLAPTPVYPVMYQAVSPVCTSAHSSGRTAGASLEDYLMFSTAPQSPTNPEPHPPSNSSTPPPATILPPPRHMVQYVPVQYHPNAGPSEAGHWVPHYPLAGFRRISSGLLQMAPGPAPHQGPPPAGYYFQPAVTPLLQAGMRFVYQQQPQPSAASIAAAHSSPSPPSLPHEQ